MALRSCIAILLFLLASVCASGQRMKFVGLESGFNYVGAHYTENSNIRATDDQVIYYNPDPFSTYGMTGDVNRFFIGQKFESWSSNGKWGFATGLRYSDMTTGLRRNSSPSYFYLLYDQTGTTTEYLRVREITQRTGYLGIPLEVRYSPFKPRTMRMFMMVGGDFNYQLFTKTEVKFETPAMERYEDEVGQIIGDPKRSFGSFYAGIGWMVGKEGNTIYTFGLTFPVVLTNSISNLLRPDVGGGFHLQVQFPLKKAK